MNDDSVLDARVRRGLQALPVPDERRTAAALDEVTRGRPVPGRPWHLAIAAAVVVALLVLGPQLLRSLLAEEEPEPAPRPGGGLSGTWVRTLDGAQDPAWNGPWTIAFADGGVLTLSPPRALPAGTDGAAYATSGAQVRVDAFVNGICNELSPGTYAWSRSADGLRLTAVDDACAPRVELLAGTWTEQP